MEMLSVRPHGATRLNGNGNGHGRNAVTEHYYSLAHWLRPSGELSSPTPKTVGVTSCDAGVGVSTVAANLAMATADVMEQPVLLLDMTDSECALAARLGMSGDLGLHDALADFARAGEYARPTPVPFLSILAAHDASEMRSLACDSGRIAGLLQALERSYELIVIDLPPVDTSLCFATAGLLNGVLFVVEAERTGVSMARRSKQRLAHANANLLGIIFNKQHKHLPPWLESRL